MTHDASPLSAADIIDRWPSPKAFGEDIGVKLSHVHVMKVRGSIPARRWPRVVEAAKARSIPLTMEQVERAHAAPAPEQGSAA